MFELSTGKLSKSIGGQLHFGSLPPLGGVHEPVRRIVADVEQVRENDVFWALPGLEPLAEQAFVRGALGVVVCRRHVEPWAGKFAIVVDDSRRALESLVRCSRRQFAGQLIAVAGSLGKSTTRHTIDSLLSQSLVTTQDNGGQLHEDSSLFDLVDLRPTDEFKTLEVSSRQPSDAAEFLTLAEPDMVVLTSECLTRKKHPLIDSDESVVGELNDVLTQPKCVIVNGDDPRLHRMACQLGRHVTCAGRAGHNEFTATDVRYQAGELSFVVENTRIVSHVAGRHRLSSLMLAYAVARAMGMSPGEIADVIHELPSLPNRCQISESNRLTIIDDTYHATVDALAASLLMISESPTKRRRIFVCGDIAVDVTRPCHVHRLLAKAAVTRYRCDGLVTCGTFAKEMQSEARIAGMPAAATQAFDNVDDAVRARQSWAGAGDVVLVAGHRMSGMRTVVEALKETASEMEETQLIGRVA